jgi:carboxypeptidase C (cathepsin A)
LSSVADFDVYDIRAPSNDPNPPKTYSTYISQASVKKAIGAKSTYQECSNAAGRGFSNTGDSTFPFSPPPPSNPTTNLSQLDSRSFLSELSTVVQSGVTTLVWAGDADWICNWYGGLAAANAISYSGQSTFKKLPVKSYTVNGTAGGTFKTQGNLSWMRVFGAGHEVPFYTPALALQAFVQTMQGKAISST